MVCQRLDASNAWQFPQGGMEAGESPDEALRREMREELGSELFAITSRAEQPVRYEWPDGARGKYKDLYCGQEQWWFLLRWHEGAQPQWDQATDPEFDDSKWVAPQQAVDGIISWKRAAYCSGLTQLGFEVE